MKFFQDVAQVTFTGIDKVFEVSSVFCEFSIGGKDFSVKWYGVIIAFGFTLAVLFGGRGAYKWKMDLNKMIDVLIYGTLAGIIGARLYYCAFSWDEFKDNPIEVLYIWNGGLAIYGGIIAALLAAFVVCKIEKLSFGNLLDLAGMSLLIGQGIGRWGNFANQEAFGCNTDSPFGMWSEKIASYIIRHQASLPGVDPSKPVHPTFLYESIWCLVGFALLFIMCKKFRKFSGQIFLSYGVWYGLGRMLIEGLRTDSLYIGDTSLRVSQLLSGVVVIVFAAVLMALLVKYTKNPKPIEGVDYYIEPAPFFKSKKKAEEKPTEEIKAQGEEEDVQDN